MRRRRQIIFFLSLVFLLAVVWAFGATQIARAGEKIALDSQASDEVVDNDVFLAGQKIALKGTVNGDVVLLANQVEINGTVNGSLFVIGQQVVIQGNVTGTTYVAAITLDLGPEAVLERNLYFVGLSLTTQPGSAIQRDLNTICIGADLNGEIGRNTRATIGILEVIGRIFKAFGAEFVIPGLNLRPGGLGSLGITGGLASMLLVNLIQGPAPAGSIDTVRLTAWFLNLLREIGLLFLLGAVFYWLFRKPLNRTSGALRLRPLPALGYGLLALLIAANIYLVGLLVASMIFVIGFWLGNLGLWSFTIAFWALAYSALAFFLAALWFLIAYGTKLIVAYLAGSWFFEKVAPKASLPPFLGLVLGVVVYTLLHSIPMLGWVVGILVTAWGLGGFWLGYRRSNGQKVETLDSSPE